MTKRTVRGTIRFPTAAGLPPGAKLRIRVLDVSIADVESPVVAEKVLDDIAVRTAGGKPVIFDIEAELESRPPGSYAVSVHVDATGDGSIKPGDFINTQRYALSASDTPASIDVEVTKI